VKREEEEEEEEEEEQPRYTVLHLLIIVITAELKHSCNSIYGSYSSRSPQNNPPVIH